MNVTVLGSANLKQIYIVDLACVASVSVRFRAKKEEQESKTA